MKVEMEINIFFSINYCILHAIQRCNFSNRFLTGNTFKTLIRFKHIENFNFRSDNSSRVDHGINDFLCNYSTFHYFFLIKLFEGGFIDVSCLTCLFRFVFVYLIIFE